MPTAKGPFLTKTLGSNQQRAQDERVGLSKIDATDALDGLNAEFHTMPINRIRIELFGDLCIHHEAERIDRFPTQKTASVLAYLAIQFPRLIARDVVATAIWPGVDAVSARNSMNQAVSSLRHLFPAIPKEFGEALLSGRKTIALNSDLVTTDVSEFVDLLSIAKETKSNPERLKVLERAAELYRGDLLPTLLDPWIAPVRLQLRQARGSALRQLIRAYSKSGEPEVAIPHVLQLLRESPLSASFHSVVMELHIRAGDTAAAESHFLEATKLFESAGEEVPEGLRTLKNKAIRLAKTFQAGLIAKDSRTRESRISTRIGSLPSRVPRSWDAFIGRQQEMAQICQLLENGVFALGLIGIGGIGKTRLAIESAHQQEGKFAGGIFFLGQSGPEAADRIAVRLLQTMGILNLNIGESPITILARQFPPESPVLFVLDELEHLGEEGVQEIIAILTAIPSARLIYTSRRPLQLPGEVRLQIDALDVAAPSTDWDSEPTAAVQLFLARAHAAYPEFRISEGNHRAISEICLELEGIPLAIELAASRVKFLSTNQIHEEIIRDIDFLRQNSSHVPKRHRSLRAAIAGSIHLLTPSQVDLLTRLSTIAGSWSLALARNLSLNPDVTDDLHVLATYALVRVIRHQDSTEYRLPDIIRAIIREGLSAELEEWCLRRQTECFLLTLDRCPEEMSWVPDVAEDYGAMIALMNQLLSHKFGVLLRRMVLRLAFFWKLRGPATEGLQWMDLAFNSEFDVPDEVRPIAKILHARLFMLQGDFARAESLSREGLDAIDKTVDATYYMLGLRLQLALSHQLGDFAATTQLAESLYEEAIQLGELSDAASAMCALGNQSVDASRFEIAQERYQRSLALATEAGNDIERAMTLSCLANLMRRLDQYEVARELLVDGLEIFKKAGLLFHTSINMSSLALCDIQEYRPEHALELVRDAVDTMVDVYQLSPWLFQASYYALAQLGHFQSAAKLYGFVCNLFGTRVMANIDDNSLWEEHLDMLKAELTDEEISTYKSIGSSYSRAQALALVKSESQA